MNNKKLNEMVRFAYKNSPFYSTLYKSFFPSGIPDDTDIDLEMLPLIEKSDVSSYSLLMMPEQFHQDYIDYKLINYRTSGSTGICLEIFWSLQDGNNSLLSLWYLRKKYYGISPKDKCCAFYSNMRDGYDEPEQVETENYLSFSKNNLDDKRLIEIYSKMLKFQPVYMIIEPSIALLLAECKNSHGLENIDSLKYIELTGEFLFEGVRQKIQESFGCKTADQYGAYEVNSIAYECPEGNLHCMSQNVVVEVLDDNGDSVDDGEEGNIYVTSLTNHVMPFIRYKIGDKGKIFHSPKCKCGNSAPTIELTNGRCNDMITCADGSKIHCTVFTKAVENTNRVLDNCIKQFQIHQLGYNDFGVHIVLNDPENVDPQKLVDTFLALIEEKRLADSSISFAFYDRLFPDPKTGKLYYFINDMK